MEMKIENLGYPYIKQVSTEEMTNKKFTILAVPELFGRIKINICDISDKDDHCPEGHGCIAMSLICHSKPSMDSIVDDLKYAENPIEFCDIYRNKNNQKYNGRQIIVEKSHM